MGKDMGKAANLGGAVKRAGESSKGKIVLLVCDDLWPTSGYRMGYLRELKNLLRDALKSELMISTRDRTIVRQASKPPVSFECVGPRGSKVRKILGVVAFGVDWQQITSNWGAELDYVGILDLCVGLPQALVIVGSGVHVYYVGSRNREGRKDSSFAVRRYFYRLKHGSLEQ